ncbi:g10933 [Coccomyxa elongata]
MRLCSISRRQPGASSTVTVDRAWLESLLLDEVGSRIKGLSDKELMAMLEQLVRSRQPGSSPRSAGHGASQGVSNPLQGMGLAWPWVQRPAPELQSGPSSTGDAVLDRLAGTLPGWLRTSDNGAPDDDAATQQPSDTRSAPSPVDNSTTWRQDAQTSSAKDMPLGPPEGVSRGSTQQQKEQPMPVPQMRSDEAAYPRMSSPVLGSSAALGEKPMVGDMDKLAAQDRGADDADSSGAREEPDLTGSLLEASGLPMRLREDGLPEASTAAVDGQRLNGSAILERARQVAGSAAAAAAAAIASGMQSVPADNPLQGVQFGRDGGLPPFVETALQLALVAGVGAGIYTMLRLLGLGGLDGSGAEDPAARDTLGSPRQQTASPQPSSQEERGRAPSAWDILKLVPNTLLGFPVSISRPSATAASILPNSPHTSDDQGVPDVPPRGPPPAYSGSTSPDRGSGLGSARAQHLDSTILWQREETPDSAKQPAQLAGSAAPESILCVRSEAGQTQRAGARLQSEVPTPDSTVLWRRDDSSAPASFTFPGRSGNEEQGAGSGYDGESRQDQSDLLQPSSSEVDPWRAPQQPLSRVISHDATAEDWIKLHAALQPRGEDPWRDPPSGPTQMAQPGSASPGQSQRMELSAAAARAHERGGLDRRNGAVSGVSRAGGQDSGRREERMKVRVRDRNALYNNVERVPPARQQAAYMRK